MQALIIAVLKSREGLHSTEQVLQRERAQGGRAEDKRHMQLSAELSPCSSAAPHYRQTLPLDPALASCPGLNWGPAAGPPPPVQGGHGTGGRRCSRTSCKGT